MRAADCECVLAALRAAIAAEAAGMTEQSLFEYASSVWICTSQAKGGGRCHGTAADASIGPLREWRTR